MTEFGIAAYLNMCGKKKSNNIGVEIKYFH